MVYLFLEDGFEEVEAVATADFLRRAGIEVKTVSVGSNNAELVTGSHGISVKSDIGINQIDFDDMEAVVLPGGMPGTLNLENSDIVISAIKFCYENNKWICAICAAPSILGHLGILDGKEATCFPGFESAFPKGIYTAEAVTVCGNIITADGPKSAIAFGETIAKLLGD